MCGSVRYQSVSLDRHACATLLSLVWGADSPPKTELLLTNSDACAGSKLLSRVLWVQAGAGSQLSGIVGCAGSECHVWGPQAYLMASLHASMQLSVQWEGNMVHTALDCSVRGV